MGKVQRKMASISQAPKYQCQFPFHILPGYHTQKSTPTFIRFAKAPHQDLLLIFRSPCVCAHSPSLSWCYCCPPQAWAGTQPEPHSWQRWSVKWWSQRFWGRWLRTITTLHRECWYNPRLEADTPYHREFVRMFELMMLMCKKKQMKNHGASASFTR